MMSRSKCYEPGTPAHAEAIAAYLAALADCLKSRRFQVEWNRGAPSHHYGETVSFRLPESDNDALKAINERYERPQV